MSILSVGTLITFAAMRHLLLLASLFCAIPFYLTAQTLTGTITDENNAGIINAHITTRNGAHTHSIKRGTFRKRAQRNRQCEGNSLHTRNAILYSRQGFGQVLSYPTFVRSSVYGELLTSFRSRETRHRWSGFFFEPN